MGHCTDVGGGRHCTVWEETLLPCCCWRTTAGAAVAAVTAVAAAAAVALFHRFLLSNFKHEVIVFLRSLFTCLSCAILLKPINLRLRS